MVKHLSYWSITPFKKKVDFVILKDPEKSWSGPKDDFWWPWKGLAQLGNSSRSPPGAGTHWWVGFDRLKDLSQAEEWSRDEEAKSSSCCQQHQQKILFWRGLEQDMLSAPPVGVWGGRGGWVPHWRLSQGLPSSLSHRRLHRDRKGRWSDSVFLIKLMRWGCWQQIHPFSPSPGTLKRAAAPPVPAELPSEGSKEQASAEPLIAGMGSASPRGAEQAGVGAQPSCSEPGCSRFSLSAVIFVPLLHVNWWFLFPFFWLKHLLLMLTNNKSFFPPARRGCKSIQKRGWGGGKGLHALFPASALQPSLWLSATLGGSTTNPPHQRAFCQERQGLQNVLVGLQGCWKLARPRLSARLTGFLSSSYQERWGGCLTPSLCCRKVK